MKVLPNEKFSLIGDDLNAAFLARLDFNVIAKIKSPCSAVIKNGFTSGIVVGYHTNLVRLISQLVFLGPTAFRNYLEAFSKNYDVELELLDVINNSRLIDNFSEADMDGIYLDSLLKLLNDNRDSVLDFIEELKKHKPVHNTKSFKDFKELDLDDFKFYISYVEILDPNISNPTVFGITSRRLIGSFNLDFPFDLPNNYDDCVEYLSNHVSSYGISYCVKKIVEEFQEYNDDLFSLKSFRLSIYSSQIIYGFIYDLVYNKIWKLVKCNVNEG